jgi:hypothetical protein
MNKQRQTMFNEMIDHLVQQGCRSYEPVDPETDEEGRDEACLYRGPNETKCAIGALINDEFYTPDLEGQGPLDPKVSRALERSGWSIDLNDQRFLSICQQGLHDRCNDGLFLTDLRINAQVIASEYSLDLPPSILGVQP